MADIVQEEDEEEEVENIVDLEQVGEALVECDCDEFPLHKNNLLTHRIESEAAKELPVHEATPPEIPLEITAELKATLAKNVSKVLGKSSEVRK